ncbi:hypothetical protein NE664_08580 [Anaerotignum faecicola]|nr:hypothetical protein [Anaerotignum faecicola]
MEKKQKCPCINIKCRRHGDCVSCRKWHKMKVKKLPFCERGEKKGQDKNAP